MTNFFNKKNFIDSFEQLLVNSKNIIDNISFIYDLEFKDNIDSLINRVSCTTRKERIDVLRSKSQICEDWLSKFRHQSEIDSLMKIVKEMGVSIYDSSPYPILAERYSQNIISNAYFRK